MGDLIDRYSIAAPIYDLLSGERLIYRAGRIAAISALALRTGQTVLDIGCGTGMSLPLLSEAVGPAGHVIGVDRSPHMLARARDRIRDVTCKITLARLDATEQDDRGWRMIESTRPDAVLFAYSLSVMRPSDAALEAAMQHVQPGARVSVVDMASPVTGGRLARAAASAAAWLGGADLNAHPWRSMPEYIDLDTSITMKAGHLQVNAGTRRTPDDQPDA